MLPITPKRGARWADIAGGSSLSGFPFDNEDEFDDEENVVCFFRRAEKDFNGEDSLEEEEEWGGGDGDDGTEVANDRSQIERRARPWATEARRPTVQMMVASRVSSSSCRREGSRYAARTKGNVVEAYDERDNGRKEAKE